MPTEHLELVVCIQKLLFQLRALFYLVLQLLLDAIKVTKGSLNSFQALLELFLLLIKALLGQFLQLSVLGISPSKVLASFDVICIGSSPIGKLSCIRFPELLELNGVGLQFVVFVIEFLLEFLDELG